MINHRNYLFCPQFPIIIGDLKWYDHFRGRRTIDAQCNGTSREVGREIIDEMHIFILIRHISRGVSEGKCHEKTVRALFIVVP